MIGRQVLALTGEKYSQDPVTLLTQCEANCIGIPVGGQPAAASCVTQIATRRQIIFARACAFMPRERCMCLSILPPREAAVEMANQN